MSTCAPCFCNSRTTSTTLEFLISGQFSLKVMPRTSARAPLTWMRLAAMSWVVCSARANSLFVFRPRARQDHLGVIADLLRLVRQVVGIHPDAVAAHQSRPERQEVPLAAGRVQHFLGVDLQAIEEESELIDQRDVHVALRVFDH